MPQLNQRSFTAGEIAPALRARSDLTANRAGLALCRNFFVRAQGGVYSRPGLRFIGEQLDSSAKGRLIEFSFNTEQTYILLFENLNMRVIRDGGFVTTMGPSVYNFSTPYTSEQLDRLSFTQSADVMTIVHPDHDPSNLSRIADDNWVLDVIDYGSSVPPPTYVSSTDSTITNITQANPAVVTAVSPVPFSNGNIISISGVVGMTEVNTGDFTVANKTTTTFELEGVDSTAFGAYVSGGVASRANISTIGSGAGDFEKTYSYVVTAINADGIESLQSPIASITTDSLSVTAGVQLEWNPVAGASYYRVYKDPSQLTSVFGWIGDSNVTQFSDFNKAPITSDTPPQDRQPFNGVDNKPATVNYYQQRQVYGNTNAEPQSIFTTQTGNYKSLRSSSPAQSDDAITQTIVGQQVNEIRHIISLDSLVLLTSGGEWLTTEGQDQVLEPSTVGFRIQSYNGSSIVRPVVINSTALYVQEKGGRIRDLGYEFSSDRYTGNDLSVMSEHLFDNHTVVDMTYADEPYGILWCVRDDGVLLGLTYLREHQVFAWHQHDTQGLFESAATISEDGRDATYVIVNRTINGQTARYVERLEKRITSSATAAFFVDSGLTYDGAPSTVISGLEHLESELVTVLADGNEVVGLTVESGSITLPTAASVVHVGLSYLPVFETLDVDDSGVESPKGKSISIGKVVLDVEDSRGGFVGALNEDGTTVAMYEIKPRFDSDGYEGIKLKSYKADVIVKSKWAKSGGVRVEQRSPLPMAVRAIIPDVSVGGG